MRILFTVQGEGRGHLTQALALWEMLSRSGHELVGVVAGTNPARTLPRFFLDGFPMPVTVVPSAGFVFRRDRGVDLPATLWRAARHFTVWRRSLTRLRGIVDQTHPDLVVNFFEPLTGLLQFIRPLPVPVLAIAHQFHLLAPDSVRLPHHRLEQWWLRAFIRLVGCRSWRLALSFTPAARRRGDDGFTLPPLLRREISRLAPETADHVLIYLLNHGYAAHVRDWHRRHPDVKLECFYDLPGAPPVELVDEHLTFHTIDPAKFLSLMASSRAVVTTAGFESVCEAAFLGKPVVMVPVEGHLEQMLNAADGERAGLGVARETLDLDVLHRLPTPDDTAWFKAWCLESERRLGWVICQVMGGSSRAETSARHPDPQRRPPALSHEPLVREP